MTSAHTFAPGAYRFLPSVFQYSAGVAALPGYEIRRMRFRKPVPLAQGFERMEDILRRAGRPLTALCGCELRSPAPFTDEGFQAFNETYVVTLRKWGLVVAESNPVARTNVCPESDPPAGPGFHAFCFTVEAARSRPTFVIAGSGEAAEGPGSYRERTVRPGETTPEAIREKARYVLAEMERRLGLLGFGWPDTTAVQIYTVHDIHPFLADEIVRRGAGHCGLTWHYARPPVRGLEYEMDCAGLGVDAVV